MEIARSQLEATMKNVSLRMVWNLALAAAVMNPFVAYGWVGAAAERAAQRAATQAAERAAAEQASKAAAEAASRRAATNAADRVVKRWTSSLCKPAAPCPLPERTAGTFNGGSYNEVILGSDTVLYRAIHDPKFKFGKPGEPSYWSRSDAKGVQAVIDSAIPVLRNGNTAERLVAIRVPKGKTVFEGKTQEIVFEEKTRGIERGPIGGGNQVVIDGVKPEWEIKLVVPRAAP